MVRDSIGNVFADGDTITIVRILRIKGSTTLKVGTRVHGVRLIDAANHHDIDTKVDSFAPTLLKSSVRKRV